LGGPAPDHNHSLQIGTHDRHRRGIDHGRESFLRLPLHLLEPRALDGFARGRLSRRNQFAVADFEGRRHGVERGRERADLVTTTNRGPMAELTRSEFRRIVTELPQRPDDPA